CSAALGPDPKRVRPFLTRYANADLRICLRCLSHRLPDPARDERARPCAVRELQGWIAQGVLPAVPEHRQPLQHDGGEVREAHRERRDGEGSRPAEGLPDHLGSARGQAQPVGSRSLKACAGLLVLAAVFATANNELPDAEALTAGRFTTPENGFN